MNENIRNNTYVTLKDSDIIIGMAIKFYRGDLWTQVKEIDGGIYDYFTAELQLASRDKILEYLLEN
jgi:hypothetical protein